MGKKGQGKKVLEGAGRAEYDTALAEVAGLLERARGASARAVNAVMTATYWQVGRRIVEAEQGGKTHADYGALLLKRLGADLTARFGRGFSWRNLYQMRGFYLAYRNILQTPSAKCQENAINVGNPKTVDLGDVLPLPWSHYVRLTAVEDENARRFYETEALRNGWTVRQLDRQIGSLFYQRTLLSRNKAAMLAKAAKPEAGDEVTAEQQVKDPFVLEFLGLKDEYSEQDLEEALVRQLETFLLEIGGDFAFVARQRRLRVGDEWYRVDLLFFHRKLRCLIIIDLKTGKFTHADAGQMHLYCNYAAEHWTNPGENPPVGLILCSGKDEAVARYAPGGLPNKVLAAEYRTALPEEKLIEAEVRRTRKALEAVRRVVGPR